MDEKTISSSLIKLRKKHALTQKGLADKLGVSLSTIKNWEEGICYPDVRNLSLIADVFHTTTDYILDRDSKNIISACNLPESEQKRFLALAQAYIDIVSEIKN